MFYTVAEVAEMTKLSKVSIYNKLKLKELKPFVSKKKGITYISEEGLKLIKNDLKDFKDEMEIDTEESAEAAENGDFKDFKDDYLNDYVNYLKIENERLWSEMEEKNNQIAKLSQLVENGQVLLREKPKQDIQLLQEHFEQTEEKILQIREKMQSKQADHEAEHKSIWDKLFANKNLIETNKKEFEYLQEKELNAVLYCQVGKMLGGEDNEKYFNQTLQNFIGINNYRKEKGEYYGLYDLHEQYPNLSRKDCISLKNSLKQYETYSTDTSDFGREITAKHKEIIERLTQKGKI